MAGLLFLVASVALVAVSWSRWGEAPATAFVEETVGKVVLASETGAIEVAKGTGLRPGQILRTGPSSAATLKAAGGIRLSLGADTMAQALPGNANGFFVSLGTAAGEGGQLSIQTLQGQVDIGPGAARVDVFPTTTWVEVTRGTVRVRSLVEGKTAEVPQGSFIAIGAGREFSPRPAAEGLLGYWPFEDAAGNVARDESGHGNDGTFLHSPVLQEGKRGRGAGFDGTNYVEISVLSGAKFPASGTIAFWVKGDFKSQEFTELFDRYDKSRPHLFVRGLQKPPGLQVVFQKGLYPFERVSPIAEGDWNHVAVTWDTVGKTGTVYLNGSLSYTAPITDPSWVPDGQFFRLGGMGYSATAFRGVMDEVRLYGTPLSPEAIRDLYNR